MLRVSSSKKDETEASYEVLSAHMRILCITLQNESRYFDNFQAAAAAAAVQGIKKGGPPPRPPPPTGGGGEQGVRPFFTL